MYSPIDIEGVEYQLKPMNCPFHITIYRSHLRSYRELPLRYAELGTVYRFERSGVLHGLMRVRGFTQDDAHIFCRMDQLEDEILRVLDFVTEILKTFGFERYDIYLSTKPEKASGSDEQWEIATGALRAALEKRGLPYEVDPGEGTFYGPKIDLKIKDSLDRSWQCSTIQVDFHNPNRFEMEYIAEDGKAHRPVMVHRALLGSLERFFGVLIEHYAGAFPLWLAPVQAVVVPVTEKHQAYAHEVERRAARRLGLRVHVDDRNEKLGYKIREAQVQKVPYMLVVGDKEVEGRTVSVRHRHAGDLGASDVAAFGCARHPPRGGARGPRRGAPPERRRCLIDSKTVRINDRIRAKEVRVIDEDGSAARHHAAAAGADAGRGEGARPGRDRGNRDAAGLPDHELRQVLLPAGQARRGGAQAPAAHPDQGSEVPAEDRRARLRVQAQERRALPRRAATRSSRS